MRHGPPKAVPRKKTLNGIDATLWSDGKLTVQGTTTSRIRVLITTWDDKVLFDQTFTGTVDLTMTVRLDGAYKFKDLTEVHDKDAKE